MKFDAHGRITTLVAAFAVLSACSGGSTAPDTTPASVVLSTTAASLVGGGTLQLSAVVKNAGGDVLTDKTVTYSSDKAAIATVSSTGLVTAIGPVGSANITGSVAPATSAPAAITVSAAAAKNIAKGTDLPSSPVAGSSNTLTVKVTDSFGNPVSGVAVTFAATAGGGSVTPTSATTDASGLAGTSFKIGNTVGANTATATVAALVGSPVNFSATSVAGTANSIAKIGTDPTSVVVGTTLSDSVRVQVTDALGNGKPGVNVAFAVSAGGGTITPATVTTDASGKAAAKFTTGSIAGTNTATATVSGLSAVSFSTTTIPNIGSILFSAPGLPTSSFYTDPTYTFAGVTSFAFKVEFGGTTLKTNLTPGTYTINWPLPTCNIQGGCGQPVSYGPSSATQQITLVASTTPVNDSMSYVPITGFIRVSVSGLSGTSYVAYPNYFDANGIFHEAKALPDGTGLFTDVKPGTYTINWPTATCNIQGGCGQPYDPSSATQQITVRASATAAEAAMTYARRP